MGKISKVKLAHVKTGCEEEEEEKVHNQITLDWLFVISPKRYIWGIRKNEKQILVARFAPSEVLYTIFRLGNSFNRRNKSEEIFLTFSLNEKWWKTWQWTLHVFNVMFEICTVLFDWWEIDGLLVLFQCFPISFLPSRCMLIRLSRFGSLLANGYLIMFLYVLLRQALSKYIRANAKLGIVLDCQIEYLQNR